LGEKVVAQERFYLILGRFATARGQGENETQAKYRANEYL
jgi:hypothetical protein